MDAEQRFRGAADRLVCGERLAATACTQQDAWAAFAVGSDQTANPSEKLWKGGRCAINWTAGLSAPGTYTE